MQNNGSAVSLDPVEYGQGGAWAINLWFRASPSGLVGDQFAYLFSQQNSDQAYTYGWEANQVCLQACTSELRKEYYYHCGVAKSNRVPNNGSHSFLSNLYLSNLASYLMTITHADPLKQQGKRVDHHI